VITGVDFAFILAIISGIVWAVRVEAKANRSKDEIVTLKEAFNAHEADKTIHHNADAFAEFEKRIDLRFTHLSDGLKKVETYVEDIDKKIERYLNEQ
jgi:hypothetical protein